MRLKVYHIILALIALSVFQSSCKKEKMLTTGGTLKFSVDTLMFDTVFTAAGSFTASFKIYNPQNDEITISNIHLQGGANSYFHLNVDGFQGNSVNNIRIHAHDSVYVFATVKIDPTDSNTPFIITDDLIATLNGKQFTVPFTAFGQNAHYIVDSVLSNPGGTITWGTDKPYVILHNAAVDSNTTLIISAGCRVYVNQDSRLLVYGKLKTQGTKTDSVIFQGDRLDRFYFGYEGYPGEWGGFYFFPSSSGNIMSYTKIVNCGGPTTLGNYTFLAAVIEATGDPDFPFTTPQLSMDHCVIANSIGYGIFSYSSYINMSNCLVNTCGAQNLAVVRGGNYNIKNCTFVTYGTDKVSHTDNGVAAITNYEVISDYVDSVSDLNATLTNCVFYGSLSTEFVADALPGAAASLTLQNCLVRADSIDKFVNVSNTIINKDPKFVDYTKWNYHAAAGSPIIDAGTNDGLTDDLDGNFRPKGSAYDIGCYEY